MKIAIRILLFLFPVNALLAQSFTIHDVIISDTASSLVDMEIDWAGHHFVWADHDGIWVGAIDPLTGDFSPKNGKGVLIDSTPSYRGMQMVANGPEWAMSKNGSVIIYPDSASSESGIQIGTSKLVNGRWVTSPLPNSINRVPYFGSYDENYLKDGITCSSIDPVTMKGTGMRLRNTTDSAEIVPPSNFSGGRWIKGLYGISLGQEKTNPYEAGYFDAEKKEYAKVANFTNPIDQVWVVTMPEYNNLKVLWCIEKKPEQDEIAVFALIGKAWTRVGSHKIPTDRRELSSPEPFWWNGKTYLFLEAGNREDQPKTLYPQIWVMALDPNNKFYRMVSEDKPASRRDPEVFYTTTEPVIYYMETRPDKRTVIHKCSTGLNETRIIYPKATFEPMTFTKDYFPGTLDKNGRYLGSTETMTIIQHKGKLFAGMGNWMDYPWQLTPSNEGSQILRKDSYNSPWVVDTSLGYHSVRTDAVLSITFDKDYQGRTLSKPVNMLVCGAAYTTDNMERELVVWTRDDERGIWSKNVAANLNKASGIRSFKTHTDKVTGKQWLFCGVSEGNIIKAAYDPDREGKLIFDATQELQNLGRIMAMCECNGDLYAAAGVDFVNGKDTVGGLYRRIDGANPTWELVYRWPYNQVDSGDEPNIMRGITTIKDPKGTGTNVIVGTRAYPGIVEIIEPHNNHNVYMEFHIKDFFSSQWDMDYKGPALSAYNYFVPDTLNGKEIWWQSLWTEQSNNNRHPNNGSHFLVRYADGKYEYADIFDNRNPEPNGKNLRACRTICKSPFKEEPYTYYFGGYDCANDTSNNTSWIHKGKISKYTSVDKRESSLPNEFLLHQNYPNPFNPSTIISFQIPQAGHVTLKVFDVLGREAATLVDETQEAGFHQSLFSTQEHSLASGVYFYRLSAGSYTETKQMLVIK